MRLDEFKVGDKVRRPEWDADEFNEIIYKSKKSALCVCDKGLDSEIEVYRPLSETGNDWKLYIEPKKEPEYRLVKVTLDGFQNLQALDDGKPIRIVLKNCDAHPTDQTIEGDLYVWSAHRRATGPI